MAKVYLGVGTNLGDRQKNIVDAFALLEENQITILKKSTIIETKPVGGPSQENYLNAVLEIKTTHAPHDLLKIIKSIEKQLGRTPTIQNGPRVIDLDILWYEGVTLNDDSLTIPHPRMSEREFVLTPLKEIAPTLTNKLIYANN